MKIILASDHGGFEMKEKIKANFGTGYQILDVGHEVFDEDDDYVDYAARAVEAYRDGDRIILLCKNGMGMCVTANRFSKIRCGLAFDVRAVERGRMDDDINAISIPADYVDEVKAEEIVKTFLETKFAGEERYQRRLDKLTKLK